MSDFVELHLSPDEGEGLRSLGWPATHPFLRAAVPPVARGHHLVVVTPPSPAYLAPALAGLAAHLRTTTGTGLLLVPPAALDAVADLVSHLLQPTTVTWRVLRSVDRDTLRPDLPGPALLVTTPDGALALQSRSLLSPTALSALAGLWPEQWEEEDPLPPLLQELPAEAVRLFVTARPEATGLLIERHAWKAATVSFETGGTTAAPLASRGVQVASVPWGARDEAIEFLAALAQEPEIAVWTADTRPIASLTRRLAGTGRTMHLVPRDGTPPAGVPVLCYDLPPAAAVAGWESARIVLLSPPGTEPWVRSHWPHGAPVAADRTVGRAAHAADQRRAAIAVEVERGDLDPWLLALAPLFETYGAPRVAAALARLWQARPAASVSPPAHAGPPSRHASDQPGAAATGQKVWIGAGKRDQVGPNDIVGLLTRELGMERQAIGRIEIRESFSLVEVAGDAASVAERLAGRTLRKRRLAARVDRGRTGAPPRR